MCEFYPSINTLSHIQVALVLERGSTDISPLQSLLLSELLFLPLFFQSSLTSISNESITIKGKQFFVLKMIGRGGSSKVHNNILFTSCVCDVFTFTSWLPFILFWLLGLPGSWPQEAAFCCEICWPGGSRCSDYRELQEWDRASESPAAIQRSNYQAIRLVWNPFDNTMN